MSKDDRARRVSKVSELVAAIDDIIHNETGANVLRSGWDGSFTPDGGTVARMIDDALTEAAK